MNARQPAFRNPCGALVNAQFVKSAAPVLYQASACDDWLVPNARLGNAGLPLVRHVF